MEEFREKLVKFLDSECSDYDLEYSLEFDDNNNYFETKVKRGDYICYVYFRYKDKQLQIELHEDSWYDIDYFEWTVKYFWMIIVPWLFPNKK